MRTYRNKKLIILSTIAIGALTTVFNACQRSQESIMAASRQLSLMSAIYSIEVGSEYFFFHCYTSASFQPSLSLLVNSSLKSSKWKKHRLVVIPAVWKEINWANRSTWPLWLRQGLDLFNDNASRSYDIHLYQRVDPNSTYPYDWPYCANVQEEAGVYLKFIYDYYHDLPDKMLFLHGNPYAHSPHPIETGLCVRDDVHYVSINTKWFQNRRWTIWPRDHNDNIPMMYKCAKRLLTLFGFDGEAQLNPYKRKRKRENIVSIMCCAQFYVTKERIRHYTYKQWSSVYRASLEQYCPLPGEAEVLREFNIKWFGGALEHIWHVILGFHATDMPPPKPNTNTDRCHLFRPSCPGSPCSNRSATER